MTFGQFRFVHLGMNPGVLIFGLHTAVEQHLSSLPNTDWYRYAGQNYVVWTNLPLMDLVQGFQQHPTLKNVSVLATEFSSVVGSYAGFMPKEFWDWFNKPRLTQAPLFPRWPSATGK